MNYREAIDFLYSRLPMFTRTGAAAYKTGLGNIEALCEALGNPERQFRSIHIAGTNGKGSSSHLLASILQKAGYKTGLFTSPHLKDFRERIRVNGKMIAQKRVSDFVQQHRELIARLEPSFFEMNVALAFDEFARKKVDVAVIETGLGGRLDSTNVIIPELSLITNISFDHADLLGNTLELIAGEKAGIIKPGIPVVISEKQAETAAVFQHQAKKMGSPLRFAEDEVHWEGLHQRSSESGTSLCGDAYLNGNLIPMRSPLGGMYQKKNLAGVLVAIDALRKKDWKISDLNIIQGIADVVVQTGLRGRWEKLSDSPRIYCDTGHNEAGIQEIIGQLHSFEFDQLHWVWGMVADKEVTKILSLLPKNATYYFCKAQLPRAMDAALLQEKAQGAGLKGKVYPSVKAAFEAAKAAAKPNDLVLVGGSTFVVAEVI